jgi:DUF4097 and DUF4098 domain-containing protein YvlB
MNTPRKLATWMGAILGATCALLLTQAHAKDNGGEFIEKFHQTYRLASAGRVSLENINGGVHISAWDRNEVKVDAIKHAHSQQRLDEAKIQVDAADNYVSIRTQYPEHNQTFRRDDDWDNPATVEYTLTVPADAKLDSLKLVNGSLDIQGVSGDVRAECINGHLTASGLRGRVQLSTINGQLETKMEALPQSAVELSSINGGLSLVVPSDARAELEASTVHGGIDNDFGLRVNNHRFVGHDLRGQLGGGGTRVKLSNVNGRIEIRHAQDGRPISPAKDLSRPDHDDDEDSEI